MTALLILVTIVLVSPLLYAVYRMEKVLIAKLKVAVENERLKASVGNLPPLDL